MCDEDGGDEWWVLIGFMRHMDYKAICVNGREFYVWNYYIRYHALMLSLYAQLHLALREILYIPVKS
jgi:hypothetical protein